MSKTALCIALSLLAGIAVGGFAGYKYAEKKYKDIADEEVASVKERFTIPIEIKKEKNPGTEKSENVSKKALNKPSLVEYTKKLHEEVYTNYSDKDDGKDREKYPWEKSEKFNPKTPYVISPDEYGEDSEYDEVSLTLYADGILANRDDEIIEDVDEVIGKGSLEHMGDYEEDAVHVCDPKKKIYYEILADENSYEKATKKKPHPSSDEEEE